MKLKPILLIGAGGHAKACIDVIEQEDRYQVVGLVGLSHEVGAEVFNYPILGSDNELPTLLKKYKTVLITVGQIKTPAPRIRLYEQLQNLGCHMPIIISPKGYVSPHAKIAEGSIIMHGAVVNAGARIGRNCIINTNALIEHDVEIGDHCHISTASVINGDVKIGCGTFIGSGSRVRQSLMIGKNCMIGMDQRVVRSCENDTWLPKPKEIE